MSRPTPIYILGIKCLYLPMRACSKMLLLVTWVGLMGATVNHILQRHAATGTLVLGKSTGAPRKTTSHQDRALCRMVRQDHFICTCGLMAWMRNPNLYLPIPTRMPLLTANHHHLCLEWTQRWQNLTMAHWQHVIFDDESRFQLCPVDGRLKVHRLPGERFQQRRQAYRVQAGGGSVHGWRAFHNGAKWPFALPDKILGIATATNTMTPHLTVLG